MPKPTETLPTPSSAELSWFGVPATGLSRWWPNAQPFVERALAQGRGEYSIEDVKDFIEREMMQLWLLYDGERIRGVLITELCNYPRLRTCFTRFFSADDGLRAKWIPMLSVIEAWAKAMECDAVEVIGREGWKRILPGYRQTRVVLRKDL